MLLIALAVMCLAASLNAEQVSEWYWDQRYKYDKEHAQALLKEPLHQATAKILSKTYERGNMIDFDILGDYRPIEVRGYHPSSLEEGYVSQAFQGRYLIVYYEKKFGNKCILGPTMENARRVAQRPKPARVPDDKISRYISLAGKLLGGMLLLGGIYSFRNQM